MFSIFVFYSHDRQEPFWHTKMCIDQMERSSDCEKLLIVDGDKSIEYDGWKTVLVPRVSNVFCWANMWNAAVKSSSFPRLIYLDSDRLLPPSFLNKVDETFSWDSFSFSSHHFQLVRPVSPNIWREALATGNTEDLINHPGLFGLLVFEQIKNGVLLMNGKGVMSGCTAFAKDFYLYLGGVDPWYCGHGAYADTDFQMLAYREGAEFYDLKLPQLHWPHAKRDNQGKDLKSEQLRKESLTNYKYYASKWNLPKAIVQEMEYRSR